MDNLTKNVHCWCQVTVRTQRYILYIPSACLQTQSGNLRLAQLYPSSKVPRTDVTSSFHPCYNHSSLKNKAAEHNGNYHLHPDQQI